MAEETQAGNVPMKRKLGHKKGSKGKKNLKVFKGFGEKIKTDKKMQKLFRKRARDYNSDDDEEPAPVITHRKEQSHGKEEVFDDGSSDGGEDHGDVGEDFEFSEDENGEIQPGITKFAEGCKAFKMAFKKITKKSVSDNVLGPVLSAHKKLIAEKLADEEAERKVKGEAKKEKHMVGEKGHMKPANFLDTHEKFLIGVATKGAVKLFNAVNKAQNAQKGLNPSRSKDAKVIKKRRKEAFFSELSKMPSQSTDTSAKVDGEGPAWAPLRDNYMLTNSKLKDWDKMPETTLAADNFGISAADSSSDEED